MPVVVENMPVRGLSHFMAPGDVDLCGLGLGLDVGHAFASGTLDAWLAGPEGAAALRAPARQPRRARGDEHLPLGAGAVDAGR